MTTSVNTTNRDNVVMSELKDYDSLYKVDFNFDTDVTNMSADVLSEYINRVLANHPYYIEITNIVDIIVDKKTNKVTVIVSNKEVGERLTEISNNPINDHAVIGAFTFKKAENFIMNAENMIIKGLKINNEYYLDNVLFECIKNGLRVAPFKVDQYNCWGTPSDLLEYFQKQ